MLKNSRDQKESNMRDYICSVNISMLKNLQVLGKGKNPRFLRDHI